MSGEKPRKDVTVHGAIARATAQGFPATVLISTAYWRYWLDVAIRELESAVSARAAGLEARRSDQDYFGNHMLSETKASMVAAVASAACVESFAKTVAHRLGTQLPAKSPIAKASLEVLTKAFDVDAATLDGRLRTLFDDRNKAIHSAETDDPTEPHPLGVSTGAGNAYYTVERAVESVESAAGLLLDRVSNTRTGAAFAGLDARLAPHHHGLAERAAQVAALKARLSP